MFPALFKQTYHRNSPPPHTWTSYRFLAWLDSKFTSRKKQRRKKSRPVPLGDNDAVNGFGVGRFVKVTTAVSVVKRGKRRNRKLKLTYYRKIVQDWPPGMDLAGHCFPGKQGSEICILKGYRLKIGHKLV